MFVLDLIYITNYFIQSILDWSQYRLWDLCYKTDYFIWTVNLSTVSTAVELKRQLSANFKCRVEGYCSYYVKIYTRVRETGTKQPMTKKTLFWMSFSLPFMFSKGSIVIFTSLHVVFLLLHQSVSCWSCGASRTWTSRKIRTLCLFASSL